MHFDILMRRELLKLLNLLEFNIALILIQPFILYFLLIFFTFHFLITCLMSLKMSGWIELSMRLQWLILLVFINMISLLLFILHILFDFLHVLFHRAFIYFKI